MYLPSGDASVPGHREGWKSNCLSDNNTGTRAAFWTDYPCCIIHAHPGVSSSPQDAASSNSGGLCTYRPHSHQTNTTNPQMESHRCLNIYQYTYIIFPRFFLFSSDARLCFLLFLNVAAAKFKLQQWSRYLQRAGSIFSFFPQQLDRKLWYTDGWDKQKKLKKAIMPSGGNVRFSVNPQLWRMSCNSFCFWKRQQFNRLTFSVWVSYSWPRETLASYIIQIDACSLRPITSVTLLARWKNT